MRVHEKRRPDAIRSSVGITESNYNDALDLMLELGVLEHDDEGFIRLDGEREEIPPFTAVFETRTFDSE